MDHLRRSINYYDNNVDKYLATTENVDMSAFIDEFLSQATGKRILDIACGPGRDIAYMRSRGFDAVGMDLSMGLLSVARGRGDVAQMDMRKLGYRKGSFDGAYCLSGLIHLSKLDSMYAVMEMAGVLKPGAPLFLSVLEGDGENKVRNDRSYTYFCADEMEEMLGCAGFVDIVTVPPHGSPFMEVKAKKYSSLQ